MVSTIGYLPTSSDLILETEFSGLFPSEHRRTLVKLTQDTMNLLSPLAQARTRQGLDVLLKHASPRYVYLQSELLKVVWPQLRDRKVSELLASYFSHLRALTEAKSDLFGETALNQFLGALQSYEAFLTGALSGLAVVPYPLGCQL